VTEDAQLTGVPLFEIHTDVASAGVRICVVGGDAGMAEDARARLIELTGRWSPTGPDSEIKRINESRGRPVPASAETVLLVGLALQSARETDSAYDPRASRGSIDGIAHARAAVGSGSGAPWTEGFAVEPSCGTVAVPPGTALDLRGVDLGLAADLVVADMLDAGAYGVCVDVGGHVRAAGAAPSRAGWLVRPDQSPASGTGGVRLRGGAVATRARPAPELRGGRQSAGVVAVTVVAATAWQAATIAQAAMRAGRPRGPTLVGDAGGAGLFRFADGTRQSTARWSEFAA
jgi:thiamine biosynthesis lipoprotein